MKTSRLLKIGSIGIAYLLIQACSHPIEIEGQGNVMSASGTRTCLLENFQAADAVCSKNYAIGDYTETYYPTAKPGWKFDHWVTYCTTATPPNYDCAFDIPATTVKQYWFQTMPPLKAVFARAVTPITGNDIVTADGKEWAQPDLFTSISWNQMNTACPFGACKAGAILNGKDLTGWTWAGFGDVAALYNSFGIQPPLPTDVPGGSVQLGSKWAPAIYDMGRFRPTLADTVFRTIYIMLPLDGAGLIAAGDYAYLQDFFQPGEYDYAGTNNSGNSTDGEYPGVGMLLHRPIP